MLAFALLMDPPQGGYSHLTPKKPGDQPPRPMVRWSRQEIRYRICCSLPMAHRHQEMDHESESEMGFTYPVAVTPRHNAAAATSGPIARRKAPSSSPPRPAA